MLIQSWIIWALGLPTIIVGTVANLRFNGPGAAAIFLGIIATIIYFSTYQIECLIYGKCAATAWFNMLLFLVTISGVLGYYYIAIRKGELPRLSKQNLFALSTAFQTTRDLAQKRYNVDIADYIDKFQHN
jgi:hypothetical protein